MKITIDTKEDSPEEIKKVISFLSGIVGEKEIMSNRNIFDDSKPSSDSGSNAFLNMFGSNDPAPQQPNSSVQSLQKKDTTQSDKDWPMMIEYI